MTPEEKKQKQLSNLKPFKPGQSGNPKGRPKGIKNWSTIVQNLLADDSLVDRIVSTKRTPDYESLKEVWDFLPSKNGANAIGAAMMMKALQGDQKAAEWIRKTGFGDKIDVTSDGERITASPVIVSEIVPRSVQQDVETEAETTDDDRSDK